MNPRHISSNAFADFIEAKYKYSTTNISPFPAQIYTNSLSRFFNASHPQQVYSHFYLQLTLHSYPSSTSTSLSSCSFHSKYLLFKIHHLTCDTYPHGASNQGWSSHLLSYTSWWIFYRKIFSLSYIKFPVYLYLSFQCGLWPTDTTSPSYSSLPALAGVILKTRCMTTDD